MNLADSMEHRVVVLSVSWSVGNLALTSDALLADKLEMRLVVYLAGLKK